MHQVHLGTLQSGASPEPRKETWEEKLAEAEITADPRARAMRVDGPSQVLILSKGREPCSSRVTGEYL